MKSVFTDKTKQPTNKKFQKTLGDTFTLWQTVTGFTHKSYREAKGEWNFASEKYGWGFRISDKKRVLVYLLPRDKFFKVAFVFGQKATDKILQSNISDHIKKELQAAKIYAEGRGIRIEVKSALLLNDLKELITIKIAN